METTLFNLEWRIQDSKGEGFSHQPRLAGKEGQPCNIKIAWKCFRLDYHYCHYHDCYHYFLASDVRPLATSSEATFLKIVTSWRTYSEFALGRRIKWKKGKRKRKKIEEEEKEEEEEEENEERESDHKSKWERKTEIKIEIKSQQKKGDEKSSLSLSLSLSHMHPSLN